MKKSDHQHKSKLSVSNDLVSKNATENNKNTNTEVFEDKSNDTFPDYPSYPPSEDIYSIYKKEDEVDIEHPYSGKIAVDKTKPIILKEKEENDFIADDLDIPGDELDDEQEFIGSEDEENNYYSLGGDNHENLDENTGDDYD